MLPPLPATLGNPDAQFLRSELRLAHTFLDTAGISRWPENSQRCFRLAENALNTVAYFASFLPLPETEQQDIQGELQQLRQRLRKQTGVPLPEDKEPDTPR